MFRILKVARALIREKVKDLTRSPRWPAVRDGFLKTHPACAACGGTLRLQVHHVKPFHAHPELELDPRNLITLCMGEEDCHLNIGHGDNWKAWNPGVRQDALAYAKGDRVFIREQAKRRALRVQPGLAKPE